MVAMSGGVDSSTAAALLLKRGYEVIGITMRLWSDGPGANRCCPPEAIEMARRVAEILGIPFYVLDYAGPFYEKVVCYFVEEYVRGRTPNPCLACNRFIKFDLLLHQAQALEADYLATGHYARIKEVNGRYKLLKGVDPRKEQSYVLYMLSQEQLSHLIFPLGEYTKQEVRQLAREMGLPVAEREESQELCFITRGDYRDFLRRYAPEAIRPGPIYDREGNLLGTHKGLPFYTIGQRRGLGIPYGEPLYVIDIDVERNALIVGTAEELSKRGLLARQVNYISGQEPETPLSLKAKIRYQAPEVDATLYPLPGNTAEVIFREPLRGITPGQAVVFYRGEEVLGGGIIERAF